ncbi:MAG: alpha/beta fold hydrolase [Caldilineaceae bacterium]
MALMADDAVALLDQLGIEKAHVVSWASSAVVGLDMAMRYPERVDKLVLHGPNYTVDGLAPDHLAWFKSLNMADMVPRFEEQYNRTAPDPDYLLTMLNRFQELLLREPNYTVEMLSQIQTPTLVIDGDLDDWIVREHLETLATAVPNGQLLLLPELTHFAPFEDAVAWTDAVLAFLNEPQTMSLPESGAIARVNDINMYYEIHGEGEPLLLIHSVAAYSGQLAKVIPALAENYQVIAVDFRGHGRTTDAGQPLSYELIASDMVALLDQLGIDAVHIVGNKDGGITGLVMAMQHPERVKSLVTASVNWSPAGFQPWFVDYMKSVTLEDWDGMVGEMYRTVAPDPSIMAVMLEKDRNLLLTQPNFTLEELRAIDVPVLVLAGANEEVIELPHIEEMAAALPNAELVLIDEAGHGVLDEQFAAWMAAVQGFLAKTTAVSTEYAHPEALVSTEWLAEHLSDPGLRILDTRDFLAESDAATRFANYEAGHIPGAVYVDAAIDISDPNGTAPLLLISKVGFEAQMGRLGIGNDTTVVAYDEGTNIWSARFWWALRYYGHDNVKLLNGGLAKWTAEGRTLETGTITPEPTTFTATVRPELLATKDDVKQAIEDPTVTIIDSLPPAFYSGELGWPGLRVGHIPTARNLYVEDNLNQVDQTLLPIADLTALWQPVNLTPEQEVITYCGAGYAGAMNLFVLYQMGYEDISLYDGSWMEWGADLTLPVEVAVSN